MGNTISMIDQDSAAKGFRAGDGGHPETSQIAWSGIRKPLIVVAGVFLLFFFLPIESHRFTNAVIESLGLVQWYAREHVLLCLVPAFFIAGAIAIFISQAAVITYLGAKAPKTMAYGVASVSGSILAVCSCTVLPLFAGIWKRGAGLGPAIAFLYSGPAINVLAIILTARILGPEIGVARAVGAVMFSIIIGLVMHLMYRHEEETKASADLYMPASEKQRSLGQNVLLFAVMVGLLVSATWGKPDEAGGLWGTVYAFKWHLTGCFALVLGVILNRWMGVKIYKIVIAGILILLLGQWQPDNPLLVFSAGMVAFVVLLVTTRGETEAWFLSSWDFAKQILPLLLAGVLTAGLLLGRPETEGLIPSQWINSLVGGNSLWANLFASLVGAFMYFATLTEIPILQGLIGAGMGKGPALALLLAGPALSLPNMLVIRSVLGTRKTMVFVSLVVVMSTICGLIFGTLFE
ncbi:MAG: permease [Desulfobacteraceae bacterium]|jgi:uncharacterized membrane protein YraQ (UPF0718 family)